MPCEGKHSEDVLASVCRKLGDTFESLTQKHQIFLSTAGLGLLECPSLVAVPFDLPPTLQCLLLTQVCKVE